MAAEHELTPSSYIGHHLAFLQHPVGEGSFWTLNVDSLVTSALLGVFSLGFLWWVVRGATSGVPNKRQAFVAILCEGLALDRKSTRLNSSHSQISYAVFCLKQKKTLNVRSSDSHALLRA